MRREDLFLKKPTSKNEKNNIIFLDINGVIMPEPEGYQHRFDHDLDALKEYLYKKYGNPEFLKVGPYDIGAAFYDFDFVAVARLHQILDKCDAKIVLSTDWRNNGTLEMLKTCFEIYGLEDYVIDKCRGDDFEHGIFTRKKDEIISYVDNHDIDKYLIFDDCDMTQTFKEHFRKTHYLLTEDDYWYSNMYFNNDLEVIEDEQHFYLKKKNNNAIVLTVNKEYMNGNDANVLYIYVDDKYDKHYLEYLINYLYNKDIDYLVLNRKNIKEECINHHFDNYGLFTYRVGDNYNSINDVKRRILKRS